MKKRMVAIIASVMTIFLMNNIAYAAIEDVNSFLEEYQIKDDTFFTEEYGNEETGAKSLFIRAKLLYNDEKSADKSKTIYDNEASIIEEMSKQEWFDYNQVFVFNMGADTNLFAGLREYSLIDGTYCNYVSGMGVKHPWIIKTKDDLDDQTIYFLGNVTEELLYYNIDDYVGENPGGIDPSAIEIKESNGVAELSGNVNSGGKEYKFIIQFTYEVDANMNGTYNALYVGLNDVPVYGEYKEISNIKLN